MERVLIIDNDEISRQRLQQILVTQNYHIEQTSSGESALALIEKNLPDIILLDVVLPGQDGFEVCRKIKEKEKFKMIPIIFITALEEPINKVQGFEAGGSDYITKPFRLTEVLARVKSHLKIHMMERELLKKERQLGISALIVTLSHKINNALGAFPLWKEFAKERKAHGASGEDVETLDSMLQQINYIVKLLRKITMLSQEGNLDQIKYTEYVGEE
ncbi:MAG: response regulator, partial [Thermodesulfobacteriota bacterium]